MRNTRGLQRAIAVLSFLLSCAASAGADEAARSVYPGEVASPTAENRCAAPKVKETFEYYEISGHCESDLRQAMRKKANIRSKGRNFDSTTNWELKWDYGYIRNQDSCSIDAFAVDVNIVYRYPKWIAAENAHPELLTKWDRYFQGLVDHESLHRYHVVSAAEEITRAVAKLPPAATCAELDRAVKCLCDEKLKEMQEYQDRYDSVSGHGAAQGAVFP